MAGGQIICGDLELSDKSGSALTGVLDELESLPDWNAAPDLSGLFARIRRTLCGDGDPEWSDFILIEPAQAQLLQPLLESARRRLVDELGTSDPHAAIDLDAAVEGLDPVSAKWGAGRGWRLYCIIDLIEAAEHSVATGEVIAVAFS